MTIPRSTSSLLIAAAFACSLGAIGCSKKDPEPAAPATAPAESATPTAAPKAPEPAAPATPAAAPTAPKADPVQSMVSSARKAADDAAAQVKELPAVQPPAAPTAAPEASPQAVPNSLTALQNTPAAQDAVASLAATTGTLQKQAEELLARYSGELTTLTSGVAAVKSYVDQHPEILPETAKVKYQQLTTMVPQLQSLVGTLRDYKTADLTTLVPKLQNDFAKAQSLYSEVRALLPDSL